MIKKNTTYENANPEQTDNQEDNPSTENAGLSSAGSRGKPAMRGLSGSYIRSNFT